MPGLVEQRLQRRQSVVQPVLVRLVFGMLQFVEQHGPAAAWEAAHETKLHSLCLVVTVGVLSTNTKSSPN